MTRLELPQRLLAETEAAEILGIKPNTLAFWRYLMRRGEGDRGPSFVRVGRRVLYRPQDLQEYVNNRLEGSNGVDK